MNLIKENRPLIITFLFIIIGMFINYFIGVRDLNSNEINTISGFSFWYYSFNYNFGTIIIILSPLLIVTASVLPFYRELKSGFIQNVIVRKPYKKYIYDQIKKTYLRSFLLFPLISVLLITISTIIFGSKIYYMGISINSFKHNNPWLFVLLMTIGMVLYSITNINLGLILSKFINKFYLLLIALFLIFFFIGFGETNFIMLPLSINLSIVDLFFTASSKSNWLVLYFIALIRIIITSIIVYFLYKDKESLVLQNEE